MNRGLLCCVGHMGYMGVYKEGVGGGIKYRRERTKRNKGFWEKPNES